MYKYILASGSPRRIELLKQIINDFDIMPSNFDENALKESITEPSELAQALANSKAEDIFNIVNNNYKKLIVISGDTLVSLNNVVLGKPIDEKDAFNMLEKLQGTSNDVYTGMSVIIKNGNIIHKETVFSKTTVYMKKMSKEDILWYIGTKEPMDKAGAYAIQDIGSRFIDKFIGSYNAVVGLDIDALKDILKKYKVI